MYTVFIWFDVTSEAILKSLYCTTSTLPVSFLNKINSIESVNVLMPMKFELFVQCFWFQFALSDALLRELDIASQNV